MKTFSYNELYVEKAQIALANMLDYAVNDLHFSINESYNMFLSSSISSRFALGDCSIIMGKSGVELVHDIIYELNVTDVSSLPSPSFSFERTPIYWTGWALSYYQWYTTRSFQDINKVIPIDRVLSLYFPYHEMDIMQFVDKMNEMYNKGK